MFYVYTLTDPRDGAVFYVGKGKGNRIDHHEAEAKTGKRSRKCERIRDVWAAGGQITKRVVSRFDDEDDAFELEIALIADIGLHRLTNVLPGGQGRAPANALTPEQIKARFRERRLRPRIVVLSKRFTRGAAFPMQKDARELGQVFVSALRSVLGAEPASAWKVESPQPYRVLGQTFPGPCPIQVLLEIASSPTAETGTRMDALNSVAPYCRPCEA